MKKTIFGIAFVVCVTVLLRSLYAVETVRVKVPYSAIADSTLYMRWENGSKIDSMMFKGAGYGVGFDSTVTDLSESARTKIQLKIYWQGEPDSLNGMWTEVYNNRHFRPTDSALLANRAQIAAQVSDSAYDKFREGTNEDAFKSSGDTAIGGDERDVAIAAIRDSAQFLVTATGFSTHSVADVWNSTLRFIMNEQADNLVRNPGFERDSAISDVAPAFWTKGVGAHGLDESQTSGVGGRWQFRIMPGANDTSFVYQDVGKLPAGNYWLGGTAGNGNQNRSFIVIDNAPPTTTSAHIDSIQTDTSLIQEIGKVVTLSDTSQIYVGMRVNRILGGDTGWFDNIKLIHIGPTSVNADVTAISGVTVAADNLEEAFDDDATGPTMRLRALNVVAVGTDSAAVNFDGTGAGAGLRIDGGATGSGLFVTAGVTADANDAGLRILGGNSSHGVIMRSGTNPGAIGVKIESFGGVGGIGLEIAGDASAAGVKISGGSTGRGLEINGGSTSGDAIHLSTTSGDGIDAATDITGGSDILADIAGTITTVTDGVTLTAAERAAVADSLLGRDTADVEALAARKLGPVLLDTLSKQGGASSLTKEAVAREVWTIAGADDTTYAAGTMGLEAADWDATGSGGTGSDSTLIAATDTTGTDTIIAAAVIEVYDSTGTLIGEPQTAGANGYILMFLDAGLYFTRSPGYIQNGHVIPAPPAGDVDSFRTTGVTDTIDVAHGDSVIMGYDVVVGTPSSPGFVRLIIDAGTGFAGSGGGMGTPDNLEAQFSLIGGNAPYFFGDFTLYPVDTGVALDTAGRATIDLAGNNGITPSGTRWQVWLRDKRNFRALTKKKSFVLDTAVTTARFEDLDFDE